MAELKRLVTVKSIVTLLLTIVFCVLLIWGKQIPQEFTTIYTTITAFYFGTQAERLNQKIDKKE